MSQRNRLTLLQTFAGLVGVASVSALTSLTALALSDSRPNTAEAPDVELRLAQASEEAGEVPSYVEEYLESLSGDDLEDFCERFPNNSRCSGVGTSSSEPSSPSPDPSPSMMEPSPGSDSGPSSPSPDPSPSMMEPSSPSLDPSPGSDSGPSSPSPDPSPQGSM